MYYVENGKNRKLLKEIFFLKSRNRKLLCIVLKTERIENIYKQNLFSISRHRKPVCIMLKMGKIENN